MGMMTLENFRTEVQSSLGNMGFENTRLDSWINLAYLELAGAIEFEALESIKPLISGSPIPPRILVVKAIRDEDNNNLLRWVPKVEYFRLDLEVSGLPTRWTRIGNRIQYYPRESGSSSTSYTALVQEEPDPLINSIDKTVLPAVWDMPIFFLATHFGLMATGQENRAMVWFNRAIASIQSKITDKERERFAAGLGMTLPKLTEADYVAQNPNI